MMEMEAEELVGLEPAAVLGRWLDLSLMESLRISEELSEEERAFRLEAARLAVKEMAPEGSGIEEKMQAVAYVCCHAAGLDDLAQANSRFLPGEVRAAALRPARQFLALAGRQSAVLTRLRAARVKAEAEAALNAKVAEIERQWEAKERARAKQHGFDPPEAERSDASAAE